MLGVTREALGLIKLVTQKQQHQNQSHPNNGSQFKVKHQF